MGILPFEQSGSSTNLSRLPDVLISPTNQAQPDSGSSLGGKLVRGLVAPLQLIDTPRRAIISGLRELVDAIDANPETKASFSDFGKQTLDTDYGFGTAFADPTGNKLLDRIIGFAGDVALDPLTYLTLGAGKFAGAAGRATAGGDLLNAARVVDRVSEAKPLVQAVSSKGVTGLSSAQRALYDDIIRAGREAGAAGSEIGQAGLRLRVPFTRAESGIIPGSRTIAENVGRGLSSTRQALGRTGAGQRARTALAPKGRVGLYNAMSSGDTERLIKELDVMRGGTREAVERGVVESQELRRLDKIIKDARAEGVSGEQISRELASGELNSQAAKQVRQFLDDGFEGLADAGSTIQYFENYIPRMLSDEGIALRSGDLADEVGATIGVVDELAPEGIVLNRKYRTGSELKRGDKSVVLTGDDPFAFNQAMRELYPELGDGKFVVEDSFDLAYRWTRSAAAERGRLAFAEELRNIGAGVDATQVTRERGILGQIGESVTDPERLRKAEKSIRAERAGLLDESEKAVQQADQALRDRAEMFAVADEGRAARASAGALNRENQILARMEQQIDDAERKIADLDARSASIDPAVATPEEVDFLQRSIARTRQQLENAKFDVGDPAKDDVIDGLIGEMDTLSARADTYLESASDLRSRPVDSTDPRLRGAQNRRSAAVEQRSQARAGVEAAQDEGFLMNLDGETTLSRLNRDIETIPDKGNRRFKREVRALTQDVPEGELLTRDEKYLAGLRQRAASGDEAAAVGYATLLSSYATEARIAAEGGENARRFANFFSDVTKKKGGGEFRQNMLNQLEDGWKQIEGTGVAVPEELYRIRERIVELNKPEVFSGFMKAWQTYTRVFKAYVTATPRFHVRNGMSATFMNFSDGVTSADMIEGVRIWKKYLDQGLKGLDDFEQNVIRSVLGSGAGQYDAVEVGLKAPPGTGWSRKLGRNVEGAVRAAPAVSTLKAGGSLDEAVSRITRLHFDYSQYSSADRVARQIFPFWTFMSRNLPLQVTQMWTKPRAYQIFNTTVRNVREDPTGTEPDYYFEGGGFRLPFNMFGMGQYVRPDLGFSRVDEDVDRLADPIRFLADANPAIKALVENFADKQLYKDIPLDDTSYVPIQGWQQALLPVLSALGKTENLNGDTYITPKTEYLLDQLNPVGGLLNRYSGEGSRNEGNAIKNLLSATGLPSIFSGGGYLRDLTPEVEASAIRGRQFEQRELMRKMREMARAGAA
jgi:hypothetical protein